MAPHSIIYEMVPVDGLNGTKSLITIDGIIFTCHACLRIDNVVFFFFFFFFFFLGGGG